MGIVIVHELRRHVDSETETEVVGFDACRVFWGFEKNGIAARLPLELKKGVRDFVSLASPRVLRTYGGSSTNGTAKKLSQV